MGQQAEKTKKKVGKGHYKPIIKRSKYWPVVQLSKHRKEFIEEVVEESIKRIKQLRPSKKELLEELEVIHYREKMRIRGNPWRVDPPDDLAFWNDIKAKLLDISTNKENAVSVEDLLRLIITRYANEVAGNFKPNKYRFVRSMVKFGLRRLLNASRVGGIFAIFKSDYYLTDKIQLFGEMEHIRKLGKKGTLVMVPTHFSNLDSVLIGWIIHVLGLPPFIYGAGLNLFNIKIFAYFMNSVGAYKVDRRKKNLLYLETLKMYSHRALIKGAHSLFFPGGTRSRSGHVEKTLKRGLLGTTIEAQRSLLLDKGPQDRKIFIVPVVINYHFVLEAPTLINDYLRKTGQERFYKEQDEYSTSYRIVKFLLSFFTKNSNISVSLGRPLDIVGNYVNEKGESLDKNNNILQIADYFTTQGEITEDQQREEEYTRMLCDRIISEYKRINRVFASHLVAFVAFRYWRSKFPQLDLYNFLRLPEDDLNIPYHVFVEEFEKTRQKVITLKNQGKLDMAEHMFAEPDEIIRLGLDNLGQYHVNKPLFLQKDLILTKSLTTLYYYHNRMDGYEL